MKEPTSAQMLQRLARRSQLLSDFLAVARAGGIRQAAEQVAISQSALTRRIQELEQALEVKLFERSVQGMTLTPFGLALRHHAEMVEMNCAYAATEIADLLNGAAGELRIAAGPAWAYELAPDAVATLAERLPAVKVTMLTRMNEVTLPMLQAGELDVVLGGFPAPAARSPELRYEPLLEVEHLVYASAGHVLQRNASIAATDLARHPWIRFRDAVAARDLLAGFFRQGGLEPVGWAVETTSVQFGFRLLKRGLHLMVLPSTLKETAAQEGIHPLPMAAPLGRYVAGLMYRPSLERLKAFRSFREALIEILPR